MAGLSTIADMVPLVGENRVFAHYGLAVLRKSRRPGLQQLLRKAKMNQAYLTEEDIGSCADSVVMGLVNVKVHRY